MVDANDFYIYMEGVRESVKTAQYLGAKNLFLMSDIMKEDRSVLETDYVITKEEKMEAAKNVFDGRVSDDMTGF